MMRYLVVDVAAESYGALSVLKDFYHYATESQDNEWIFVISGPYLGKCDHIKIIVDKEPKINWFRRLIWERRKLPQIVNSVAPDRIISLQNIAVHTKENIPQLLYMHMPIPFQNVKRFSPFKKNERTLFVYQNIIGKMILRSIKKADLVIVQGEWLKKAICMKIDAWNKIEVFQTEINLPRKDLAIKYVQDKKIKCKQFLYPVAPSAFKNHECIINAVKYLNTKGITDFSVLFTFDDSGQFEKVDQVRYLGRIPREEVFSLLEYSVLLFPSYIETFGMPLLEARACGCVEIASDCPFSREILDGYPNAYFFNPFDSRELAMNMERVLSGELGYKPQGFQFSKDNSWNRIIQLFEERIQIEEMQDE